MMPVTVPVTARVPMVTRRRAAGVTVTVTVTVTLAGGPFGPSRLPRPRTRDSDSELRNSTQRPEQPEHTGSMTRLNLRLGSS
jgi:hypothetical protein